MSNYIDPTKTTFDSVEQTAIDVLEQEAPTVLTKMGSVIRELVVRPLAYLVSWATDNLQDLRTKSSIAYLKTSQATENEVADLVASNYFVTRKEGMPAKGIITITITQESLLIANGSSFSVAGTLVHTASRYIITTDASNLVETNNNTVYITAIALGDGTYAASLPVVTDDIGKFEIPVGVDVTVNFTAPMILSAALTSPITGGAATETDAQLMLRAEYNTAESGIGSYYGLLKKFNSAPVTVMGLYPVLGDDEALYRARYNNININPGGIIDAYIKTVNQPSVVDVELSTAATGATISFSSGTIQRTGASLGPSSNTTVTPEQQGTNIIVNVYAGTINIPSGLDISCLYGVADLRVVGGDVYDIETTFSAETGTDKGARLSTDQCTTITFKASVQPTVSNTILSISYMPSIATMQQFIDSDDEAFLGLDIRCKAAIPIRIKMNCSVQADRELTDVDIDNIKQVIVDTVNNMPVGAKALNFSDLRTACANAIQGVDLRLPCVFSGSRYTQDGLLETLYSDTGFLDISTPVRDSSWLHKMCYFYTCKQDIDLVVL